MAFNSKEQEIIKWGLENGKSKEEVQQALIKFRSGVVPSNKEPSVSDNAIDDIGQDLKEGVVGVGQEFGTAGQKIVDKATGKESLVDKAIGIGAEAFRGGARAFGQAVMTIPKLLVGEKTEQAVGKKVGKVAEDIGKSDTVQGLLADYNALDPEAKKNVDNALGYAEGLAEILTGGVASNITKKAIRTALDVASQTKRVAGEAVSKVESLFTRPSKSIDDVILQAESSPARSRAISEAEAPQLSLQEKWVGISPDIKKRIAGKQDKLQGYFDVAHGRNNNDTLPTTYEYGAKQAQSAVEDMEKLLSESGGKIGATREKLGTYKASPEQVQRVETGFTSQLGKLNLEIRNGVVRQKSGTVSKAGTGDVKVLNDFYQDLKVIKQSPTLTNLIEFRSALDSRVNFAKRASEASNEIDPFARQVRKDIANVGAEVVGKTEAEELARFSDFMDAYNDLRSYTDRSAGGEYLLRLVLSGRGGEARKIIDTIKEYTGKDLMDDATMMTIATDVIGNTRQQNLFRQEMTKAGLDVASIMAGKPSGAIGLLSNLMTKALLDQEKVYMKAAQ